MKSILSAILFFGIFNTGLFVQASPSFFSDALAAQCGQKTFDLNTCTTIKFSYPVRLQKQQASKVVEFIEYAARSWGDTIYEGDVDGNETGLRYSVQVMASKTNNQIIGYLITFSYEGWETSCVGDDYDRTKPQTFAKCKRGRIMQKIVVTPEFTDFESVSDATLVLKRR
ncbi:MAG: hypothetical protein ACXVCY_05735 [Pseudobdellovibrionaceae bacterium]